MRTRVRGFVARRTLKGMGKALLVVVAVVLLVYALYDLMATPREQIAVLPKWLWLAVVVLVPWAGPVLWMLAGTRRQGPTPRGPRAGRPVGPDDDPDFLRRL